VVFPDAGRCIRRDDRTMSDHNLDADAYESDDEIVVDVHAGDLENVRFGKVRLIVANGVLEIRIPYREELSRTSTQLR
jgi:hypothetical protein